MKNLLEDSRYAFIKGNPDLANIIYLVLSGSHAYGTSRQGSDFDLRGALIEPPKYLYGLQTFEQFEDLPTDTVIYGVKKFVGLLTKGNPGALELLGVDEDCIVHITNEGQMLRESAQLFLSKRVISSFGNYALAQLRRLQNALCHDSYCEKEKLSHLKSTLASLMDHFQRTYTKFPGGAINIYTGEETLKFDIELKNYPVSDFMGIYSELSSIVKTYNKLNHRNSKKSEEGLFKHSMHLIRLLMTGTDILDGKGIITNRKEERGLLMEIRDGRIPFSEIFRLADEYQAKFELAAKKTKLPEAPDMDKIDRLLAALYGVRLADK